MEKLEDREMAEDSPGNKVLFDADLIFLDKRNSNVTNHWVYYRITPIAGADIETCRVTFPDCKDIDTPIVTPLNVGLAAAYDNIKTLALKQWQVNHDENNIIGMIVRLPKKS